MASSNQNIKCVSFNCFGYKNSCFYIDRLCSEFEICFISENWLRLDELNKVRCSLKDKDLW